MSEKSVMMVLSNPAEGREDEYNEWYDTVHLPEILAVPGVTGATRFALDPEEDGATHRYLAIYEIEGEGDKVLAAIGEAAAAGSIHMSDAIDLTTTEMKVWKAR